MRLAFFCLAFVLVALGAWWLLSNVALMPWILEQQRAFQTRMADAVFALKTGSPGAWGALLGAAATYGFVHALGPGHGKYLIGGVGLGTSVSASRLLGLAFVSSLAQALWAIVLVYAGFWLIELSAAQMTTLAEDILAPMSYLAIAAVGMILLWRGLRSLPRAVAAKAAPAIAHDHHDGACGCHAHGPTPDQVAGVQSLRDALALVLSIAIRPCTGAIFLLVIAWQMDIKTAGAAAVVVMGLGTAMLTSLVAVSSTAARRVSFAAASPLNAAQAALPALQVLAGGSIVFISLGLLGLAF